MVRPAFRFATDYRASGRFPIAYRWARDDLKDPVADRIVEALLAAREVGGSDLWRMLFRTLSDSFAKISDFAARRRHVVLDCQWGAFRCRGPGVLFSQRGPRQPLSRPPSGMVVLFTCADACVLAYFLRRSLGGS